MLKIIYALYNFAQNNLIEYRKIPRAAAPGDNFLKII